MTQYVVLIAAVAIIASVASGYLYKRAKRFAAEQRALNDRLQGIRERRRTTGRR
jgi:hypothetical protein